MLTLIPLLNPWDGKVPNPRRARKAKKKNKRRKPARRETSATAKRSARSRKREEVAPVAKKRKRGRRRVVKSSSRRRGRRTTTTTRRRSGTRRRRRNPSAMDQLSAAFGRASRGGSRRRKRKIGGKRRIYRPTIHVGRKLRSKAIKRRIAKSVRGARMLRSGAVRINPRRRRRSGRRVYGRRRRNPIHRRRRNPLGGGMLGRILSMDTVYTVVQIGAGAAANKYAPQLAAKLLGRRDLERGMTGEAIGIAGNLLLAGVLQWAGYRSAAYKTAVGGALVVGGKLANYAASKMGTTRSAPVLVPAPQGAVNGMGSIVSPESMVEAQALLGDFVQLSGGIPPRDLRGFGDYIEFKSQAAGAQAMAAQLAPAEVFSPGPDEKF